MKIGFFDSGLGGLTVLKAVATALPQYDYEYYGDTKHVPYGDKTEAEIYELTKAGVATLFERNCLIIVIACNTASAETLRRLQDEYLPQSPYADRRILGVIIPVVEEVVASGIERVLMIATRRTVHSGKYELELKNRNATNVTIDAVATPGLVPLIEAGDVEAALAAALEFIEPRMGEVGGIILGCTHYTLLKEALRTRYGSGVRVFSQDEIIPRKLQQYLNAHPEHTARLTSGGTRNVYLTEQRARYDALIETLLSRSTATGE